MLNDRPNFREGGREREREGEREGGREREREGGRGGREREFYYSNMYM